MLRKITMSGLAMMFVIGVCMVGTGCSSRSGKVHDRTVYVNRDRGYTTYNNRYDGYRYSTYPYRDGSRYYHNDGTLADGRYYRYQSSRN